MDPVSVRTRLARRMRTSNSQINATLGLLRLDLINKVANLAAIPGHFSHVLYVGLTPHERYQIEQEIIAWGFREWHGERQYAEDLAANPKADDEVSKIVEAVATDLFFYWSWANAVLRHVTSIQEACLRGSSQNGDQLLSDFSKELAWRSDDAFIADSRQQRLDALLQDERNAPFLAALRDTPRVFAGDRSAFAVAPHPDDIRTWRLLAFYVQKEQNQAILRSWPGIQQAAWRAGWLKGEEAYRGAYYPFYETWYNAVAPPGEGGIPSIEENGMLTPEEEGAEEPDGESGGSTAASRSQASETDEEQALEMAKQMLTSSDVWDVWVLCKVLLCAGSYDAVDQEPGTWPLFRRLEKDPVFSEHWGRVPLLGDERDDEAAVFQRRKPLDPIETEDCDMVLMKYRQVRHHWPLRHPYQFIEFWDYSNFSFRDVPEDVAQQLLNDIDLSQSIDEEPYDLVCLLDSRRDPWRALEDLQYFRHTLYLTDDLQQRCADGWDYPGQCYPCDCDVIRVWNQVPEEERKAIGLPRPRNEHSTWDHPGGCTVFRRSKLKNSRFCQELDRYWDDWNDCALIYGRGEDDNLDIIDEDTIYILETLPGIKARQIKQHAPDAETGHGLTRAYFEAKWEESRNET